MRKLEELYYPKAKKEREWWLANKVKKEPIPPGTKSDFTGEPVKVYDRKNYGAKAGMDTAGEVCEDELDEKKVNNNYPETTDDEEDKDFRPYWVKKRKRQDTA
jgi:hypothetical protein